MQKPTVGRIVHYEPDLGHGRSQPWAAIITFVSIVESTGGVPLVNLGVFMPQGCVSPKEGVEFSEEYKPGCWSWPPRV